MIAVISDIHGNIEALQSVLADVRRHGVREIICLGDIVGYGPHPTECLDIVRRISRLTVCGNHDLALLTFPFGFHDAARRAIDWHRKLLEPRPISWPRQRARWGYVREFPEQVEVDGTLLVHASPRDPIMEYVDPNDPPAKRAEMLAMVKRVCFVGHSHRPGVVTEDLIFTHPSDLSGMRYRLRAGRKAIINIGSVGQPRDGDPRASYVLWDDPVAVWRRIGYNVEKTINAMERIPEIDNRLAERLRYGK